MSELIIYNTDIPEYKRFTSSVPLSRNDTVNLGTQTYIVKQISHIVAGRNLFAQHWLDLEAATSS